ncbi:preprotein translocase subunit SecG [Paenirhodobacter enshiensis]|uniref:preprotein translocase subunit SecG n=1 Tax=Paenirhodobacter enshiensis TaxID=1105367 RepID=UPI0035B25881
MENIVLSIHLILALVLIGVVLLQRSEGGGLGMGGGSGSGGGVMTGRQAANALTKLTWIIAGLFIVTSITLTVLATRGNGRGSILDRFAPAASQNGSAPVPNVELPPAASGTAAPATPPAADAPVTPPAAN